ncbi:hypothetical protein ACE3MQ_27005 [Paenibacillus lentus]|uniref:hypothetical protein n=1 Tax=Paenibacillus lentus TaxID=1338368 RepID=UPI003649BDC8
MKKYMNQVVEIIYMDRNGKITQRSIHIHAVRNGLVRATCLQTGAPRAFRNEQILALRPVKQTSKQFGKQPMKLSGNHYVKHHGNLSGNHPINHNGNLPVKHSVDRLANQLATELATELATQPVNHPVKHSALHPVKQPGLVKGGKYHAS